MVLCGLSGQAQATATLTCDIKDAVLELSIQAAVGSFSTIGSLQGRLDLRGGNRLPQTAFDLTAENLLQQWIDEPDLRLHLRSAFDAPTDVDLIITTRQTGAMTFRGDYRLKVSAAGKPQTRKGRASCELG